jgi:PRTRC genetic system protein E
MEPASRRSSFAPPRTPLTRRSLVYFASGAYRLLTLNVIPKKIKDDESDALTTALCITASAEELDRDLPAQLREFTDVHAKAASNIQKVKDELAAAEKAERDAADERRAKKAKAKIVPPAAGADTKKQSSRGRHPSGCLTKAPTNRRLLRLRMSPSSWTKYQSPRKRTTIRTKPTTS